MTGLQHGESRTGCWVRFPGVLEQVEHAVTTLHGYLVRRRKGGSCFEFGLLCFEALSNAVRHGCDSDPTRQVEATLEVVDGTFSLTVTDDGPGFDWRARVVGSPDDGATQGRGLWILHEYGDEVRFNDAGNQITIVKHSQSQHRPAPDEVSRGSRTVRSRQRERGPT